MTADDDVNKRLADAHRSLAEARAALNLTAAAVEAARKFASEVGLELAGHVKRNNDRAAVRAASLMASLKIGATPKFKASPKLADDHLKRIDAENRASAARAALEGLLAEEREAQREVDVAVAALHAAAKSVVAEEAEELVAKIQKLEGESLRTRVAVEAMARSGVLGWGREIGLKDAAKEIAHEHVAAPGNP